MLIPLKLVRDQRLQQQLYEQLRDLILSSRLMPGSRMPSTRMMAEQFSVSRVTVLLTYERLIAEGLLRTMPAKGTFVAETSTRPVEPLPPAAPFECLESHPGTASGHAGCPDPSLFPSGRWRKLMRSALDVLGQNLSREHPAGNAALRAGIAGWLAASRGLAVAPDDVIVVRGRQLALHVVAHLALSVGSHTIVETPCDANTAAILLAERGELTRVPVDAEGLNTDLLPPGGATLIHVTPEHQRPLGVLLSRARRAALLEWAARTETLVLEEDFEGEIRYGDMHPPSLKALDTTDNVVLVGGFRVSLGPWIDISFIVPPRRLNAAALAARQSIDDSHGGVEQMALAEFVESGGYARHLHGLTKAYARRRDALVAALRRNFGGPVRLDGDHAGLHLSWFPPPVLGQPARLARLAQSCGLDAESVTLDGRGHFPGLCAVLLGFGRLPERQLQARIARFAARARDEAAGSATIPPAATLPASVQSATVLSAG